MILKVVDAVNPPRGIRPRTLRAVVATATESLLPGQYMEASGVVSLFGIPVMLGTIRSTLANCNPPGCTYSFRALKGGKFQIWRNT